MKIKTSELAGSALDWAVAKCEGHENRYPFSFDGKGKYRPSADWGQGGPIIQREKINLQFCRDLRDVNGLYIHADGRTNSHHGYWWGDHDHPLIAAMRCYVAIKIGAEVEVPDYIE